MLEIDDNLLSKIQNKIYMNQLSVDGKFRKRKNLANEREDPDGDIYWHLNYLRFERYLRDEMVVDAYESGDTVHENCVKTLKVLLKISEMKTDSLAAASFPISVSYE